MNRYKISTSSMCFGAFRYNENVDNKSELRLSCTRKKTVNKKYLIRWSNGGEGTEKYHLTFNI